MIYFDLDSNKVQRVSGGYSNVGSEINDTFVRIGGGMHFMHGVLYEQVEPDEKSSIGIVVVHSDDDYSTFPIGGELAKRGYRTLCGQVKDSKSTLDDKILDIKNCVTFFKEYEGVEKVILMGHSGGATLMSAYQAIAENGAEIFKGDEMIIPCSITADLPPADGIMVLDSNWGNGAMTLLSIDPAVVTQDCGTKLDHNYDIFDEKNGFKPGSSHYNEDFKASFFKKQAERNNAIIDEAVARLRAIEAGNGDFIDDEPIIIAGGEQFGPCNKMIPEDISLVSHTRGSHKLIHKDGTITDEVVHCLREAKFERTLTPSIHACTISTLRSFLTNKAVYASEYYGVKENEIAGIQWHRSYNCTPGNIAHIQAPLLIMGMTGSYEYLASEVIYENAICEDKTLCFVEGAGHNFFAERNRDVYGDTAKLAFDYVDHWIEERFIAINITDVREA